MIFLLCSCFKYLCCVSDYFQTVFLISEFFLGFTVIFLAVLLDLHQFCDDQLNWAESFCTKKKKRTRKWQDLFQWIRTFTFSPFQFFSWNTFFCERSLDLVRFWSYVWSRFWCLSWVKMLIFGWGFEVAAWSRLWRWNLIKICELVIWQEEVTLVTRTKPSGPLCLWQCCFITLGEPSPGCHLYEMWFGDTFSCNASTKKSLL